jgi:methylated-DNA-[protein]-cysteine S-methyltransferase
MSKTSTVILRYLQVIVKCYIDLLTGGERKMYLFRKLKTEIGELTLIGDGTIVECILFRGAPVPRQYRDNLKENRTAYAKAAKEIKSYLRGHVTEFTFPFSIIMPDGFRKKALEMLARVPYGKTISYQQLAAKAGSPQAHRAAGSACANNPLPIVIPCHRVLKSDGTLGGFGGGLPIKRRLLDIEKSTYKR